MYGAFGLPMTYGPPSLALYEVFSSTISMMCGGVATFEYEPLTVYG